MTVLSTKRLYKNLGKTIGWWQVDAESMEDGSARLVITFAKSEGGTVTEKFASVKGKNAGRANATSHAEQAVLEAASRVSKQIRLGYVENIEDANAPVTNGLGKKKPMKAERLQDINADEIDWDNAFLQRKYDGHRCLSDGFIYSRGGVAHNVQHIQDAIYAQPSFADLHLDGELYVHGLTLQAIGSLITKPREESLQLTYYVYDSVSDKPFEERFAALQEAFANTVDLDVRIQLVETVRVRSMDEAMAQHRKWVKEKYEGSILRWGREGYKDNKRTKYLTKLKDFTDFEVKVVGWELAEQQVVKGVTYQVPKFIYVVYTPNGPKHAKATAHGNAEEKHQEYLDLMEGKNMGRMLTLTHFGFTPDGIPNIATAKCWHEPL
jgi:ATP-dependent DNA ligase